MPLFLFSIPLGFYLASFIKPISTPVSLIIFLGFPILVFIILTRIGKAIEEFILNENKTLIANTDMPQLCLDMLEASQQKYKYTNFSIKLKNYSDWIAHQSIHNRKTPLDTLINNEDQKHLGTGTFVTFDTVYIARNKLLDSFFYTNYLLGLLQEMQVIEVNLISDALINDTYENIQLRIKIIRGLSMFEIRYDLDKNDEPIFQEAVFMGNFSGFYRELEPNDAEMVYIIKFILKFINSTRKLAR